jgi:hypothetical protein
LSGRMLRARSRRRNPALSIRQFTAPNG